MRLLDEWLEDVTGDNLLIDESESGLEHEARNNLWSFSISSDQAQTLTKGDIKAFLDAVVEARRQQIMRMPDGRHSMTFYCWYDEQAIQLRFSLVSTSHGRLPFHTDIEVCKDLDYVAARFLTSPNHDGLPMSKFKPQPTAGNQEVEATAPASLQVWTKRLP